MKEAQRTIRIGTRGSPLALAQVDLVCQKLAGFSPDIKTEVKIIQTSGDWKPADGEVSLDPSERGKAQFAKEIEQALLAGEVDAAVHSMKDMDSVLPEGLVIDHMLEQEDPRDALLFHVKNTEIESLADLPQGCRVGTTSVRRKAFLLAQRPDLEIVPLRGNVHTRIEKLRNGKVDATILAYAGLKRLGLEDEIACLIEEEEMFPAIGQGAVGIELRKEDESLLADFSQISCKDTVYKVSAQRELLRILEGGCHTPIGVKMTFEDQNMTLEVRITLPDGSRTFSEKKSGVVTCLEDALALGREIGEVLKPQVPSEILG